jgi:hypothetical protein
MKTDDSSTMSRSVVVLGALLAFGLVLGAFVLGSQTRHIGSGRSTVIVKGLAEKPVKADHAEWQVTAKSLGSTFPETLSKLREEKKALDTFFAAHGFDKGSLSEKTETVEPNFIEKEVNERVVRVQEGFIGKQSVVVSSTSLDNIMTAHKAALDYKASGHDLDNEEPSYLVSNLEEMKMSLISSATENARRRAQEFIKQSDARLGTMRSASQGAFYILPVKADAKTDDYGGTYDKTTVEKMARVVVTVEFNLK